jgi:hypothetical protein
MPVTRPSCAVCGAPGTVGPRQLAAGWFKCRFCGSPSSLEGGGASAIEGPGGRVICVSRPGHTRIQVRPGGFVPIELVVQALVFTELVLAGLLWLAGQLHPSVRAVLAPILYVLLVGGLAAGVVAARTEQVLEIEPGGVRAFLLAFGRRFHQRTGSSGAAHSVARAFRLALGLGQSEDARFVEKCVRDGIAEAFEAEASWSARPPCPGCGARGREEPALPDGVSACAYCGSALVHAREALRLDPVSLPPLPMAAATAEPGEGRRVGDATVFTLPSFASRHPTAAIVVAILFAVPCTGGLGLGALLAWSDLSALPATRLLLVVFCLGLALAGLFGIAHVYWAEHTVSVSRYAVRHELHLFGMRVRQAALPLVRLTEATCALDDTHVTLQLKSPMRHLSMQATHAAPDGARFLRGVRDALMSELRAAGRVA